MADPFVSVIVPVRNAEKTLPRLLASLFTQDFPSQNFEIILVDNLSTDRSAELMRSYPVTCLSQTARLGPAATRNEGVQHARGEILAFIDSDCWAHSEWLSRGVATLVGQNLDRVAGAVEFVLSRRPNIYEIYDSSVNFRQNDFLSAGWSGTGNLFVRRELFDDVGLFDGELISHEDSEWGLRATVAGKTLGFASGVIVYHRARTSLKSLVRKWVRTEYGAAQAWKRHGLFELHLWTKKANYRPLTGTWRNFPESVRGNSRIRFAVDGISNILRMAGNVGNFLGFFHPAGREQRG